MPIDFDYRLWAVCPIFFMGVFKMLATMREIKRQYGIAKGADPATVLSFSAVQVDKAMRFSGLVNVGATAYQVAGNNGKQKTFVDVDDFVKSLAVELPTASGDYDVEISTGLYLVKPLPSDIKKAAAAEVVKLNKLRLVQLAVVASIDAELALMVGWEAGNVLQQARKADTQARKAVVVADVAAIDADIVAQTAIAES